MTDERDGWWRDRSTRERVIGLCALALLCMLSYAFARPAAESMFLEAHGAEALPKAWVLVALGAAGWVVLYNRFSTRVDLVVLYGAVCLIALAVMAGLILAWKAELPGTGYALYVWKDLYIVVLVEIFYSFCNSVFPIRRARWFYGLFGLFGATGGVIGNLGVGVLAERVGSANSLWAVAPILVLSFIAALVLARRAGLAPLEQTAAPKFGEGLTVVRRSSYLLLVLLMVGVVQVVITLIDFQWGGVVEAAFTDMDQRTAVIGRVYAVVNAGTIIGHAAVGPVLRLLTIPRTLLAVPLLLAGALAGFVVNPIFGAMAAAKVASKVFDYTIFRAAKEMLYIPLSYTERTAGKALVDMATYRVAKGGASLVLLVLGLAATSGWISVINLGLIVVWIGLTWVIVRRFRRLVPRDEELHGG